MMGAWANALKSIKGEPFPVIKFPRTGNVHAEVLLSRPTTLLVMTVFIRPSLRGWIAIRMKSGDHVTDD